MLGKLCLQQRHAAIPFAVAMQVKSHKAITAMGPKYKQDITSEMPANRLSEAQPILAVFVCA